MENQTAHAQNELFCPFCSKHILPQDILFVDVDRLGGHVNENEYDKEWSDFNKSVLSFNSIQVDTVDAAGNPESIDISLEGRPKMVYHRWTEPSIPESGAHYPYKEPENVKFLDHFSLFPDTITVHRRDGMTPDQLVDRVSPPWAQDGESAQETPEDNTPKTNSQMLRESLMGSKNEESQKATAGTQSISEDVVKTLTERACPHCHNRLPEGFGMLPIHRIMMLGGTRSGKTTYIAAASNLLNSQREIPSGLVEDCEICAESKRYFDFMTQCLEYNKLEATKLEDDVDIRFVFPMVMTVTASALEENGEAQKYLLIINDIPGEAMTRKDFLNNYPGLMTAEGAIMLIDPIQLMTSRDSKIDVVKGSLDSVNENNSEDVDYEAYLNEQHTQDPFNVTFRNVKALIEGGKLERMNSFTLVLNKLDLLYGGSHPILSVENDKGYTYINRRQSLDEHVDGIDMTHIDSISSQTVNLIENKLKYKQYRSVTNLEHFGADHTVYTLCTSVWNWNDGKERFVKAVKNGKVSRQSIVGYRLLEPLLLSLANLGLMKTKVGEPPIEIVEPVNFFRRLFHKR